MAHQLNGFELKFTARTSWKAERRRNGKLIDVVPVTWTKDWDHTAGLLRVWYRDKDEILHLKASRDPYVVAIALAKDYSVEPHEFKEFRSLVRVVPTGKVLDERSLETRVLERVIAS
jgi:hypothetical protein